MYDWTAGYTADLDYTHDFQRELTPSFLGFCATSRATQHPFDREGLEFCELGCGYGMSANILAAANPHINFHAMDFNPAHIAAADQMAQSAGLENLTFYEQSFEEFHHEPSLPAQFDVIALHGVYTWVSQENRDVIVDFIAKRLKPGGLVYVSYNSLPGWAAAVPLSKLFYDRIENGFGPVTERIEAALQFCKNVHAADAKYFTDNPLLTKHLNKMATMSNNYLAHEYYTQSWRPIHFAELAEALSGAKLGFLGSTQPLDHLDDINMTSEQLALVNRESDLVSRETLRDLMLNQQFRTDIFARGALAHTERGGVGAWFNTTLALTLSQVDALPHVVWRHGALEFNATQTSPVLQALVDGPQTVRALLDQGVFGDMAWGDITYLLTLLVGAGCVTPCLPQKNVKERRRGCIAMNKVICKMAEEQNAIQFLASPVTGGGVQVNRFEQLFLIAKSEGRKTPEAWAELAWLILAPQGQRLLKDGRVLDTEEENQAELLALAHQFAIEKMPILETLGVTF